MREAVRSAVSAKVWPCRSSTLRRQTRTMADVSSIRLSMPKAMRARLSEATPEPMATTASIVIQASVMYSRRKACRISAVRSAVAAEALATCMVGLLPLLHHGAGEIGVHRQPDADKIAKRGSAAFRAWKPDAPPSNFRLPPISGLDGGGLHQLR